MTDQELLDRVGRMNRYPRHQPLPEWSAELPDMRGRDSMTTIKIRTVEQEAIKSRSWKGAIAAAIVVVVAFGAVMQIQEEETIDGPGSWPEVVNPATPDEVKALAEAGDEVAILWVWYDAIGGGDGATVQRYMSEDAQPLGFPFDQLMAMVEFNTAVGDTVGGLSVENCTPPQTTSEIRCQVRVLDEVISPAVGSAPTLEVTGLVVDGLVVVANELSASPPPWAVTTWILDRLDPGGREAGCIPGPNVIDFEGIVFNRTCGDYIRETFHAAGSNRVRELAATWARDVAEN